MSKHPPKNKATSVKPRNKISQNPLLRKGGPHQKTNGAKRAQERHEIRKQSDDWS